MTAALGVDLVTTARELLAKVAAHFDSAGVALPERQVTAPGLAAEIAWDCPMVAVTLGGVGWGHATDRGAGSRPTGHPIGSLGLRHVVLVVQIVREAVDAGSQAVPPAEVTASGEAQLRDAGLLSQAILEMCSQQSPGQRGTATPTAVEVLGPSGGYTAVAGGLAITAGHLT